VEQYILNEMLLDHRAAITKIFLTF